ncbi:hypothetical protein RND71_039731 [Anisodus tanguticus]|uniref:Uncharacterized protein n=1 Tax=Anisodus tanguticus TaxID=243964 RepID=A0AAE1UY19_9SOLA|nr:hypothetical protein RND71_039731 [Anisodus tanguticus]
MNLLFIAVQSQSGHTLTIARYRKVAPEPVKTTGNMITFVNGIQKNLPHLTFGSFLPQRYQYIDEAGKDCISDDDIHLEARNELSSHNSKDCNPDHETIARYRKVAPDPVKTTGNMITSVNGIQKNLRHLTFGRSELSVHNSKDCNPDHETIARYRKVAPEPVKTTGNMITSGTSSQRTIRSIAILISERNELSAHNSKDCNPDHETIARYRKVTLEPVKTTGNMITSVNGIQKNLPHLTFGRNELSAHNSKDCNPDHETIARYRKVTLEPVKTTGNMITSIEESMFRQKFENRAVYGKVDGPSNVLRNIEIPNPFVGLMGIKTDRQKFDRNELSAHNSKDCNPDHETIARYRKVALEPVKTTGNMITSVNGIQKNLPHLTFGRNELSAHNSKYCNPDHETIARYRKVALEPVKTTGNMITSVNGIQKNLPHLTFGSFLPQRYQYIDEAGKDCISDGDIHLETDKADRTNIARRLQFSEGNELSAHNSKDCNPVHGTIARYRKVALEPVKTTGNMITSLSAHNSKDCNPDHESIARYRKVALEPVKTTGNMITSVNGIQKNLPHLTFGRNELSAHNCKNCNPGHETIARYRKVAPEPVKTTGNMITSVNGIQKNLPHLTFGRNELSAHNSKDCNPDHETIARYRKVAPEPVKTTGNMITSMNGIQKILPHLTFGRNELSAHNSKDCNPDHETIARYRKVAPEPVKTTGNMITSVNGIQKNLPHLTFGRNELSAHNSKDCNPDHETIARYRKVAPEPVKTTGNVITSEVNANASVSIDEQVVPNNANIWLDIQVGNVTCSIPQSMQVFSTDRGKQVAGSNTQSSGSVTI